MNKYISPPLLKFGDKVAITAPARKIDPALIYQSIEILQEWGLQVQLAKNLFAGSHSYLSGSDDERYHDLQSMLDDTTVSAIVCARGGYGTTRILDRVHLDAFRKHPKWLVGFSDVTALHLKLLSSGFQSVHATMPVLFSRADSAISVESLRKLLFNGGATLAASPSDYNRTGEAEGVVVGGNLSLIVDSLGTQTEVDTDGKILLIEEVDEYYYKVDRMFTQLARAGKLSGLKGLVIGHMTDIKNGELTFAEHVEDVILNCVRNYSYPVGFNFPTGHENPNLAWVHGGYGALTISNQRSILRFDPIKLHS